MRIHPLDLAIVIGYLLGVTALGMRFRRSKKHVADSNLEAVGLDFTAPSLFPLPTTNTVSVTRQ